MIVAANSIPIFNGRASLDDKLMSLSGTTLFVPVFLHILVLCKLFLSARRADAMCALLCCADQVPIVIMLLTLCIVELSKLLASFV